MTSTPTLFQRDFTLVVIGQIISLFGNAILRFALPLYLLRITGSPTLFGIVTACSFAPMVVLSLVGGVLADRVNKRDIMVVLDFSTAALIAIFTLLLDRAPLVPLFIIVLMLLYGISGTYQPAVQASISLLVHPERLTAANAVINQVNTLSNLLGPVLGGVLFSLWGILPILLLSVVCFFISAVMECFIHIPHTPQPRKAGIFAVARNDLSSCYHFVREERPVFFSVVGIVAFFNLVLTAVMIVGSPILITQTLALSDTLYGLTQGIQALGGLCGGVLASIFATHLSARYAHRWLMLCTLSVAGMGLALSFSLPTLVSYCIITGMSFLVMLGSTLFMVQIYTIIQTQTPPHLVGKVMAALIALALCGQPIGQALYGVLFDRFSTSPQVVHFGASLSAFLIVLYARHIFKHLAK